MKHLWLILAGLFASAWVLRQIPGPAKQPPPIAWVLVLALVLAFTAWVWTGSPAIRIP